MGTPVVVSDHGAVPETVLAPPEISAHECTGWRIPPGDADALAEGIAAALSLGAGEREALRARARIHVECHFSLERMVSDTLDVYTTLLGSPGRTIPPNS
jgi:glycosyltransferase involved in cell wall biosynthesis